MGAMLFPIRFSQYHVAFVPRASWPSFLSLVYVPVKIKKYIWKDKRCNENTTWSPASRRKCLSSLAQESVTVFSVLPQITRPPSRSWRWLVTSWEAIGSVPRKLHRGTQCSWVKTCLCSQKLSEGGLHWQETAHLVHEWPGCGWSLFKLTQPSGLERSAGLPRTATSLVPVPGVVPPPLSLLR